MDLARLAVKRPTFITCIIILMLALGYMSLKKLPVDLFPDVTFPIVFVSVPYPGAGPTEVETLISKTIEDEISTLPGITRVSSTSKEGVGTVVAEFTLETDIKYAEQQIRDRVSAVKYKLPKDAKEPIIRRIDPADQPIVRVAIDADLPTAKLFEFTNELIKPKLEQVSKVGLVNIIGGRKREVRIELDKQKLKDYELSASQVSQAIGTTGLNVPAGKVEHGALETVVRTLGEFKTLQDIRNTIVNFFANDVPVKVSDLGNVYDGLEDEKTRAFVNGKKSIFLDVYKQSGSNTIAVSNALKKKIDKLNKEYNGKAKIVIVRDGSKNIKANVDDVKESILIGIALTIIVVYFFLGNGRSTFITSLALPNSLLGAFLLMSIAGFSINVMSLLALSLSVGLLIDDAIVVRENIFRHLEMGKSPVQAAIEGTKEVRLAVIATTLTVIAVFGPIAFLHGMVGQFFKQFGLTICFAMMISLFDALTIAPMLSAYFAGKHDENEKRGIWGNTVGVLVRGFGRLQDWMEDSYEKVLGFTLRHPLMIILMAIAIFIGSIMVVKHVPKTFLPPQDFGEFMVSLDLPQGTTLDETTKVAKEVDRVIRNYKEVHDTTMAVGNPDGGANEASIYVNLVSSKKRKMNTTDFKGMMRDQLKPFAAFKPVVKDVDVVGGGQRPFNLNIIGNDLNEVEKVANEVFERLKKNPALLDVEISYKPGKPEFQIGLDPTKLGTYGLASSMIGNELRTLVEGNVPAVFRENGVEYDIRVRLQENQRDIKSGYSDTYVPNINRNLVRLSDISTSKSTIGPSNITRQDRGRYIQIAADIAPNGPGIGGAMDDIRHMLDKEMKLPEGVRYSFQGQAENFQELGQNMMIAAGLGVLFIFLVLASLYESFVTPFTIMLVLPLAACGAFIGLFVGNKSLDIFSMIGCIMLLGIATKNSILLVDYTHQLVEKGYDHSSAIIKAGRTRLRPILMTTFALIAGMIPIAMGLNEASRQRTSMGVAIIGGLISSTLLTLLVIPAAYSYIERFRLWSKGILTRIFVVQHETSKEDMALLDKED
jgi:HAE1 family hydrophobic/amphiphilic exporter-1